MGFLQIFFMVFLQIFDRFPGDIRWVSWRYLMDFLEIFDVLLEIFGVFSGEILTGFLEIIHSFP